VQAIGRQPQRAPDGAPLHYERRRPEQSTLYRLVQQLAASFIAHTEASTGSELTRFIKDEFDAFLERTSSLAQRITRRQRSTNPHDSRRVRTGRRRSRWLD
jgi:hypothetical protein